MFDGNFLNAFLLTLFAGFSTGIGALIAFFSRKDSDVFLSFGLGFSGGVMLYISFVEILPKSVESFASQGELMGVLFFFAGFLLSFFIDRMIPEEINPHEFKSNAEFKAAPEDPKYKSLKKTGVFTAIAIAIHNFPEGFATFASAIEDPTLGVAIAIAVAIHNIPEGISVSLPIYRATGNRMKAFLYSASSGIAEPIGAIIGYLLLAPLLGDMTLGVVFGIVGGIMVYISLDELIPSARVYGNAHTTIMGVGSGMAVMAASLILFGTI